MCACDANLQQAERKDRRGLILLPDEREQATVELEECGRSIPPPRLKYFHMTWIGWTIIYLGITAVAFTIVCRKEDKRLLYTFFERCSERRRHKADMDDTSRREELLQT